MHYAAARYKNKALEFSYRTYVTDCLQSMARSLGAYPALRWADAVQVMEHPEKADRRTAEEIISDLEKKGVIQIKRKGGASPECI